MSSRNSRLPPGTSAHRSSSRRPVLNGSSVRFRRLPDSSSNSGILTESSGNSRTSGRRKRQGKSVFTFVDGRTPSSSSEADVLLRGNRGETVGHDSRRYAVERHPASPRQHTSRGPAVSDRSRRRPMDGTDVRLGFGESSRQSLQTRYMQNLLTTRTRNSTQASVSRPIGILDRISRTSSSSSDDGQTDPATYFTLVEMDHNKHVPSTSTVELQNNPSNHLAPSESHIQHQLTEFKETINKLDEIPEWFQRSGFPSNPPATPKIAVSPSSVIKTKLGTQHQEKEATSAASISYLPQKNLDPEELMKKLKDISENRRTYYVQNKGSADSLLEMFYRSPQRHSIDSMLSLPINVGRDVTPSTTALAGSMATLTFIELSKRKQGSVFQNPDPNDKGDAPSAPRMKKCEKLVPPVDMYKKDMIINVPIYPLSPVDPHETVEAPSVESVIMINQICDEIDAIFKEIHIGFDGMEEQIKAEEAKENERNRVAEIESSSQFLDELKASLLTKQQPSRRSVDSRRSVQSTGSRQSRVSSLGDSQSGMFQPSLSSLPQESPMSTEELIEILNQKYKTNTDLGSPSPLQSSHGSENDLKFIYSSNATHLKRHSEKRQSDVEIADSEAPVLEDQVDSVHRESSETVSMIQSSNRAGLRRFTEKVQIPTISDASADGEMEERNSPGRNSPKSNSPENEDQIKNPPSLRGASLISGGTTSSKIREAERLAIEETIEDRFGPMKLDAIDVKPDDCIETSQTALCRVLARYTNRGDPEEASCDIFVGDPELMIETGTTQQLMLYQGTFPMGCDERLSAHRIHPTVKQKKSGSKKTITSKQTEEKTDEREEEHSDQECNEWVKFTPGSYEEEQGKVVEDDEEEQASEENGEDKLVLDPNELRLLFPFAFRLAKDSSWWKRSRFSPEYRDPITKEKRPEFDEMRDQLKALLEEYEDHYTRFETVYRWGDPSDPPNWNKKYRSPFLRPNVVDNQDPDRFHMSDDALSMKDSKDHAEIRPPGYSTAAFYVEPTKWWNLANVRRYVIRKELAKHSWGHHRTRLGLRARPTKFSASLLLGCPKRRSRKKGQICQRKKDTNKALMEMFMKKNLPPSVWKELRRKYYVATSLRYRQRHHWNPFRPRNKPSIDGTNHLGWYGQSLVRRSNITYLGQFAQLSDQKNRPLVKEIKEREIRDKWQRDIMEIAYVAYCTNKLISEELQFLVMIGFWLGVVIDEFAYFMRFVMNDLEKVHKKTLYEKRHSKKIRHCRHSEWNAGTEGKNPLIWEKILKVCDKTLFMLKRGLLPKADNVEEYKSHDSEEKPCVVKHIETDLSLPWYEKTKLRKTNRRLLDSIALAYPDYYYLASRTNRYYHVEMDEDEARWFPIRYYDADKAEYNFISHDHPKWPDWKFLHMTSYGDTFGISPVTFTPYKTTKDSDEGYSLSDGELDRDNQIQDYKDTGSEKLVNAPRDSKVSERKRALILMLMKECFDNEGNFRYILVNPIKFDRKRINMSIKAIGKTTTQMCTDPNSLGLDDFTARVLQKSELRDKHIKLNPDSFRRLLKKYTAEGESPRSFTERRIDIALDYWYQKAAQVNNLLDAIESKIDAVDKLVRFQEANPGNELSLVFDDPNALKFQNEPVWNRKILENFQHGCSGHKNCDDEGSLISRSSKSSSCSDSSETEDDETPVDRLPSDFLKVMHTYFSLTTIETLKKENFVPFPVPEETLFCYEKIDRTGQGKTPKREPYNKMSLRGRISERHRIRVERRHELNKIRDKKGAGGDQGEGDGKHARRCLAHDDDPRSHVGFKSKCPICHKMLISHHPSLTLFIEFKTKHIHDHRMHTEGIKPPKKPGVIKLEESHGGYSEVYSPRKHDYKKGKREVDTEEDCYLHCRVPTILSIFQGRSVAKNKQERLIRYFNRALHYEHAAVKDEITSRFYVETDEWDLLSYKQNYLRELHTEICERSICPTISQQIQALLNNQELVMRFKKRTILSSKFCKKRAGWPLKLLTEMTEGEIAQTSRLSHQPYPYTLTKKKIATQRKRTSRRLLNDLFICWLDAYSRGTGLLSSLAPYLRSNKLYFPDHFAIHFLDTIIRVLKHSEIAKTVDARSRGSEVSEIAELSPFERWFQEFMESWLRPPESSSLDARNHEIKDMSWVSSHYNLQESSDTSITKKGVGAHDDAVSEYGHPMERHLSSDETFEDHASMGKLIDVSPSHSTPDIDLD